MAFRGNDRYQGRDGDSEYLRLSKQIPNNILNINKNTRALQKLTTLIGTPKEPKNSTHQVRGIIDDTKQLIKITKGMIEQIGNMDGGNSTETRNRRQEQRKYNLDLEETVRSFQKSVDDVVAQEERCLSRERAESSRMGLGGNRGDKNDFGSYNDSASLIDDDERQQQEQMYAQDVSLRTAFIQEREQGVKELHSQMEQVHDIFQDVAALVQDQGEVLENIEASMQTTYDRVDQGVTELTHASRYQKSARNKAMCLLVIVVIVAGILAAILVPTLKK